MNESSSSSSAAATSAPSAVSASAPTPERMSPESVAKEAKPGVETWPATLEYYGHEPAAGEARIVRHANSARWMRAVLGGLACWGLALVSVLIPLGHFILVPAFLFAGPVVFLMRLSEDVVLQGAHGCCPVCGVEQEFTERGRLKPRHPVRCASCSRALELRVPELRPETAA